MSYGALHNPENLRRSTPANDEKYPKALLLLLCLVVGQLAQLNPWHNADQNQHAGDKDGPQPHLQLVLVESGLGGRRDRDQRHE